MTDRGDDSGDRRFHIRLGLGRRRGGVAKVSETDEQKLTPSLLQRPTDPCSTTTPPPPSSLCAHIHSAGAGPGGSSSKSNKLGLASLPGGVEVEVMQQRLQYGIGVLHNRVLRRGMDPSLEPAPLVEASAAEGRAEEEDEFDREPSHLVFVVHGIGEKMWASDAVQVRGEFVSMCIHE